MGSCYPTSKCSYKQSSAAIYHVYLQLRVHADVSLHSVVITVTEEAKVLHFTLRYTGFTKFSALCERVLRL